MANTTRDLFGQTVGLRDKDTVAVSSINRAPVFGVNSNALTYTARDRTEAEGIVQVLLKKLPDVMSTGNIGQFPNDALYHAESTLLLRAARGNGGSLAGQQFDVLVEKDLCTSCEIVLPHLGLELGNPSVTFVGPSGARATMRNGAWSN